MNRMEVWWMDRMEVWGEKLKVKKETWLATPSLSHVYKKLDRVLYPLSTKVPTKIISYLKIKYLELNLKVKLQKWNIIIPLKLWVVTV